MSKKSIITLCCIAVLCVLFGLALIIWPEQARQIICYALGFLLVAFGAASIIAYFARKVLLTGTQFGLAIGVLSVLLGAFLLLRSDLVVTALAAIIGIAVILDSVARLQIALNLKRAVGAQFLPMLICSLITLLFGAVLLFSPFKAINVANIIAGVALLIDGLLTLWSTIQFAVLQKRAEKTSARVV